jgi:hypothetical protein
LPSTATKDDFPVFSYRKRRRGKAALQDGMKKRSSSQQKIVLWKKMIALAICGLRHPLLPQNFPPQRRRER